MLTKQKTCELGWIMMNQHRAQPIYMWLADFGWQGCHKVSAVPYEDDEHVAVSLEWWTSGGMLPDSGLN